jgi:uncharacterized protein
VNALYFHGFASSPKSAKITVLRPILAEQGIELVTPDLNVPSFATLDWNAMLDLAHAEAARSRPRVVVGSSLGSLVAIELSRRGVAAPLVLIAPALGIAERWRDLPEGDPIVVHNYATNADAPIHRAFFEQMLSLGDIDAEPPPVPVRILMGRNDETVPFDGVFATWQRWQARGLMPGSRFVEIPAGDHSLVAEADLIASEIVTAARTT